MMIDTHAHIGLEDYNDISSTVSLMGDNVIINAGTSQIRNEEVLTLVSKYKNMYGSLGIHPELADTYQLSDLNFIEENINKPKIVAVGEVGIDLYWKKDNLDKQKELFIKQLELARKHSKAVVIHSRDANEVVYDIIKEYQDVKKVMHCFSGDLQIANRLIKINTMLGISGVITFKNANILVEVVKNIPLTNLLIETDSPYLAPVPFRGSQNHPANVYYVALKIAEIKGLSIDEVLNVTSQNAISQFDLKI